jgi:hypothetical protein
MSNGKLEMTGGELALSVEELIQDLHDWPTGHFVIRQRESDAILEELRPYEGRTLSTTERKTRISLRKKLRALTDAEDFAVRGISLILTDPEVSIWFLKIWESNYDAPLAIEAFVNDHLRKVGFRSSDISLRMSPPNDPKNYISTYLSKEEASSILRIMAKRKERFGAPLTDTVSELPDEVRARKATPRIIRGLLEFMI